MHTFLAVIVAVLVARCAAAQRPFPFLRDGGVVYADVYGEGDKGVVLAHGGRFNKESWEKQAQTLASADSEYWRSISAATVNREVQATLLL